MELTPTLIITAGFFGLFWKKESFNHKKNGTEEANKNKYFLN
jgi:hypothetical protein